LVLNNDITVPVSRNKKEVLLNLIIHLSAWHATYPSFPTDHSFISANCALMILSSNGLI